MSETRSVKISNSKASEMYWKVQGPRDTKRQNSKFQGSEMYWRVQMPRDTKRRNFMCHAICEMLKFCPKGPPNPRYGGKRFVPQEASREPNRFVTSLPQANPHGRCRAKANHASRPAKPATQQPASQQGQPAASTSRESIRFTTSYIDLPVKLFHILREWQVLSLQYATTLHQILHHLISAKTMHLLLKANK